MPYVPRYLFSEQNKDDDDDGDDDDDEFTIFQSEALLIKTVKHFAVFRIT